MQLSASGAPIGQTIGVAVIGALGCAVALHTLDRPSAAAIAPLAWAWGALLLARPSGTLPSALGLFVIAVAVRLPLVGSPPLLSDDLYRYLWEGLASAAGHDVLTEAPATIVHLDDALLARVNHAWLPSIYPPLALWWFRLLALAGTPTAVQACAALADATVPAAMCSAGAEPRAARIGALIYALHPLPALESAVGGHVDVPAVALAMAGLAAWRVDRRAAGFVLTALGALTKVFPVLWLPALLRGLRPTRAAALVALTGIGAALLAIPFAPRAFPPSIEVYAESWAFNGLVFPWLEPALGAATRPVLVVVGGAAALWALARLEDPARAWEVVGTAFVALSPTVHPWYLLWALAPSLLRGSTAVAWAALPMLGSYLVLTTFDPHTGQWAEAPWLWWVTWPPAVALYAWRRRIEERPTTPYPAANSTRNGMDPR